MHSTKNSSGSVLIVAMIFAAILAIALGTYFNLALSSQKLANRSFFLNSAQNLCDIGIERAMWCLNNSKTITPYPNNWTTGGFDDPGSFTHRATFYYSLARGASGTVKVWVKRYDATNDIWHAVALATVSLGDGTKINKYTEVYLQQRSYAAGGMIARNGLTFNGDVYADSWISGGSAGANQQYATATHRSNARVASPALISLQNADIYGYAAIGGDTISSTYITVGATGRLGDYGTANSYIDPNRVTLDFVADFPNVVGVPTSGNALPGVVSVSGTGSVITLTSGTYYVSSITFGGNPSNPDLILVPDGVDATIVVTGGITMNSGEIRIANSTTAKLTMYVGGDFTMGGGANINNGTAANPNNADQLTILGTRTEDQIASGTAYQNWGLQGGSFMSLTLYAPNANVDIGGTPTIYGSLVANRVSLGGTSQFHQDESLGSKRISGLYEVLKWRELALPSDRSNSVDYATWSVYCTP